MNYVDNKYTNMYNNSKKCIYTIFILRTRVSFRIYFQAVQMKNKSVSVFYEVKEREIQATKDISAHNTGNFYSMRFYL